MTMINHSRSPYTATPTGHFYYDPAIYALEQQRIFSSMWICVSHTAVLPDPGMYQLVTIGHESVILVRDQDGRLQAFLNVCQHRGTRLCAEEEGRFKGSIQCPYHAWTYGLSGELIGAPNVFNHGAFDRTAFHLRPVALEIWEGLIWLNLADHPSPLTVQLDEVARKRLNFTVPLAHYNMEQLKVGKAISYDVQANWKVIFENSSECYHCGPIHPEFCKLVSNVTSGQNSHDLSFLLAEGVEALTMTGRASRPPLPGLDAEDIRRVYVASLFPNALITFFNDHVMLFLLEPKGPTSSRVTILWLFDQSAVNSPDFDPMDTVVMADRAAQQDWNICEKVQAGMTSKAFASGGIYVPEEKYLRSFCDLVLERLYTEPVG